MICRISNMVIVDDSNMSLNGKVCQNLIGLGKIKKNWEQGNWWSCVKITHSKGFAAKRKNEMGAAAGRVSGAKKIFALNWRNKSW